MILIFIISVLSFFFAPGYKIRGLWYQWHLEAAESRLHELEGHLRVTFQVEMLRPVFLVGWCYGKIVVGFLFGCKIDNVGEIRGSASERHLALKKCEFLHNDKAIRTTTIIHYHNQYLTYNTWLTFYILLRWSRLNQLGEMQWMRMGPVRIGPGSWRHFRKTHGVRWKLHRHAMPCIGQGWTGMGWSGEWHI